MSKKASCCLVQNPESADLDLAEISNFNILQPFQVLVHSPLLLLLLLLLFHSSVSLFQNIREVLCTLGEQVSVDWPNGHNDSSCKKVPSLSASLKKSNQIKPSTANHLRQHKGAFQTFAASDTKFARASSEALLVSAENVELGRSCKTGRHKVTK